MKLVVDMAAAFSCLVAAYRAGSIPFRRWGESSHRCSPPFKLCPKKVLQVDWGKLELVQALIGCVQ
jgi:hypothetical protein